MNNLMQQNFSKAEELFNEAIEYYKPLLDNYEEREKIIMLIIIIISPIVVPNLRLK